jgi:TatD DNase family protein
VQLIDTHVHINFDVFESDLEAVRARWQENGVVRLVHSCVEPSEFRGMRSLADRFPELSLAVGLHPLDAHKWTDGTADEILGLARSEPKVVAIGETGLDFYKAENQEQQKEALLAQLEIARQLNLPVIIHCRDAAVTLRDLLQEFGRQETEVSNSFSPSVPPSLSPSPLRGVMHCWGGTPEETQWFLDLGFYISFSGVVTFKNATQIQESARIVPSDRLLIETDCPFLAPVPKRGKRNEPAYVRHVAEYLAPLRNESIEALAAQTTQNACQLFGLKV